MGWWLKLVEETSSFAAANVETRRLPDCQPVGMFVSLLVTSCSGLPLVS